MPPYTTPESVRTYVAARYGHELPTPSEDEMAALVADAERLVDACAGPWPVFSDGRKFDPLSLLAYQRDVLARATAEGVAWLLAQDPGERIGASDYVPDSLRIERRAGRVSPLVLEALVGSGLLRYSGTVTTSA